MNVNFSFNGAPDQGLDWLQFASSVIGSIAWPGILLAVILIFRKPLTELINSIEEARYGDTSVKVSRKIDQAEKTSENFIDPATIEGMAPEPEPIGTRFDQLMEISPSAAILDSWIHVEDALREVTHKFSTMGTMPSRNGSTAMIRFLTSANIIKPEVGKWLDEMRQVRNAAAHAQDVSPADALRFQELSQKVLRILRQL
ncbi:DUF4145 domain-containing protein [Sphingobium sp. KCTC 72723]|uniref:DUF4145 domain-containing protein n=1 Tax=Sphingobium sp. KCTC 72723 TaxID=2733867 RepID=UPI00165EA400|nr:DUF4145 domain-containing protein [Sphingobium sp. KCTC 72723]